MNSKTAKQLRRYSRENKLNFRQVKKWWNSLNWKEKTIIRRDSK